MARFLLPVAVAQGIWIRLTAEVIPVASGPCTGTAVSAISAGDSTATPLRLGVIGESSAAGCGVDSHEEAFAGCLARELAARTGRAVRWQVAGEHAATAERIHDVLLPRLGHELDLAVLLAGVNDVLQLHSPRRWEGDLRTVLDHLAVRAAFVAVVGIPPFAAFPLLPKTLRRYLSWRASTLDEVSRNLCAARPGTTWISTTAILPVLPDFFARDGFHPSAAGYRRWTRTVAEHLTLTYETQGSGS